MDKQQILETKLDKLIHNSTTLRKIVSSLTIPDNDQNSTKKYKSELLKRMTNIYQNINLIAEQTGLSQFDERPELLAKDDFSGLSISTADKIAYDKILKSINQHISTLEKLSEAFKLMHDEYAIT